MQTNVFHVWGTRAATFALAALAALSGPYWVLKSTDSHSVSTATPAATTSVVTQDTQAVARALGAGSGPAVSGSPMPATGQTAYVLVGVLADRQSGGAALISVDGKAAKPYRVGATVDANLMLQSVTGRRAVLAASLEGPAQMTLDMPPLSK